MANLFVTIPTFNQTQAAVDDQGRFTPATLRTLNTAIQNLAGAINTLAQIPEIQAALQDLDMATQAAQAAAAAANTAAGNAQSSANATTAATSLANSYVDPSNILSATSGTTNSTITIASHTRRYGDGTFVSVNGGSITGLMLSTLYYIYYDDPMRTGGSVSYQATTDQNTAAQTGNRHTVGSISTPAASASGTGKVVRPPGVGAIP